MSLEKRTFFFLSRLQKLFPKFGLRASSIVSYWGAEKFKQKCDKK